MTLRKEQFVNLHGHSCFSLFDGFGFPQEHMDFAYENGSRALALTDHGSMNGLSYQLLRAIEMKAQGKDFKPIFGCEAYFIPSIEEWKEEYEKAMQDKKKARQAKKAGASAASPCAVERSLALLSSPLPFLSSVEFRPRTLLARVFL